MRKLWIIPFVITASLAALFTCDMDRGIAPLPGKLQVQVAFRGNPPENTQGIYLVVAPQFPPHAINELHQSPNSLPLNQDTVITEIDLPYGSYEAFGIWWYSKDTRSNLADILTMAHDAIKGIPIGFELTPDHPVASKTLNANWDNMNRDGTIKGTVHFSGDFPENTDVTAVAAFIGQPQSALYYLVWMKSIDFSIETGVASYDYTLPVKSGYIGYIAVFWLPENASLTDVKIVAEYRDPQNPEKLTPVVVPKNGTVEGVDIYVDWNNIRAALPEAE